MLDDMLQPDKMAISRILPWMNGTTVELGSQGRVTAFSRGGDRYDDARHYKSVNPYSLSSFMEQDGETIKPLYLGRQARGILRSCFFRDGR